MLVIGKPVRRANLVNASAASGPAVDDTATGVDHRPLRLLHQRDRFGDLAQVGLGARTVAGMLDRRLRIRGRVDHNVLGQVDHHRTGPAAAGNVERLMHDAGEILGSLDQIVVLGRRSGDAGRVGLLERVVADQMCRHLAGQADDRDAVHQRIDQTRHRIGRTRPGGDQNHANTAGGTGVAFGRMDGAALLANQDMANGVLLEQRIIDRQHGAAGIAENNLYALVLEGTKKDFCSRLIHLGRHQFGSRC